MAEIETAPNVNPQPDVKVPAPKGAVNTAHDAAAAVVAAAQSGQSIRATMSGLDWGAVCGTSLLAHVTQIATEGRYYALLGVDQKADAAVVAEKAQKPEVAETTKQDLPLVKFAGYAEATQEDLTYFATAEWLISGVVLRQIAKAVDVSIVAAMTATNTEIDLSGATGPAGAVVAAQAALLANGTCPDVLALAPDAYSQLIGESASSGYALLGGVTGPSAGSQGSLFGMSLIASNAVPDGTGFIYDSRDVVVAHHATAPQIWLSGMDTTNTLNLIGDYNAVAGVASPDGVAAIDFADIGTAGS